MTILVKSPNNLICGLDEAGRGALAGPLVAAAVILTKNQIIKIQKSKLKISDSKKISAGERQKIVNLIKQKKIQTYIRIISTRIINNHGINKANIKIFRLLIKQINIEKIIVDGNLKLGRFPKNKHVSTIIKADSTHLPVILAGNLAKITRDKIMRSLHRTSPKYSWNKNFGYPTPAHIKAIIKHGPSKEHRNVFITTAVRNFLKRNKI